MNFYMPTKVFLEENCVLHHAADIAACGKNALIVTGRSSSQRNGSLKDVIRALGQTGVSYCVFSDIEENPSVETVMRAASFGRDHGADMVVGIGGGSPLDASKAVALLLNNLHASGEDLYAEYPLRALPVVAVPTTAGTGSEVTPYAILTNHAMHTKAGMKQRVFPVLALTDASYLTFLPKRLRVHTAVDALSHLMESSLNTNAASYSLVLSEAGLRLFSALRPVLNKEALTQEQEQALMQASTLAGMAIAHTGTSLPHGLSYHLTYRYGVPHGKAVGLFLASFLSLFSVEAPERTARVLMLSGFRDIPDFKAFLEELLFPEPDPADQKPALSGEEVSGCIRSLLSNKAKLKNYPFSVSKEQLYGMYEQSGLV